MRNDPFFSVILATYGRGRCIAPTIELVLRQTFSAFELIVVGDCCKDDTEAVVASFGSDRISWRNLARNCGSQSFPNNEGIRCARGEWICYIGHDDVWSSDHLAEIHRLATRNPAPDFAVSGCLNYGPPDSGVYSVTGIFRNNRPAVLHFYPPSSFAHRRDVIDRIGEWCDPLATRAPVDCDFLLRAARAGMQFGFTGRVTAHKFAAGNRYLSYLRQSDAEQRAMLRTFDSEGEGRTEPLVKQARRAGRYLALRNILFSGIKKGQVFKTSRSVRGLDRPLLGPLSHRTVVQQSAEPRALDWYPLERRGVRWSGPNPRPKILIPFTGKRAEVAIRIASMAPGARAQDIAVAVEEQNVDHVMERDREGTLWLRFVAPLRPDDHTIVTIHTPVMVSRRTLLGRRRRLGLAAGEMVLDPVP